MYQRNRILFIIFFMLISFISKGQVYQLMPQYGYDAKRMKFDSTLQIPTFCGVPSLKSNITNKGAIAFDSCNNHFYFYNPKLLSWDTIKGGGSFDTSSLSLRINGKVDSIKKNSDSIFYWKNGVSYFAFKDSFNIKLDTTSLSNRINKKIDSIYRNSTNVYYVKNGVSTLAYTDSIGGSTGRFGNDTATIVMAKIHNDAGVQLTNGKVVYLAKSGTSSDVPSVKLANNKADSTSANTFGFVTGTINANDTGWIILSGKIEKLNTASFSNGDIIYLDSISGQYTKSKPKAPYHLVYLGVVVKSNSGNGSIFVKPQNGYELDEIHDVQINSILNNQILVYSDTQKIWKNRSVYSIVDTTQLSARIDQRVKYSDTAALVAPYVHYTDTASMLTPYLRTNTASSTYTPLTRTLTINGTAQDLSANRTYSVGTVTSIATGTGLSGGTITSSGTISADTLTLSTRLWRQKGVDSVQANVNLKLNSSDSSTYQTKYRTDTMRTNVYTALNGKQATLSNPVTGTGTSGSLTKFSGTSTVQNATVDVDYLQQDMSLVALQAMGSSIKGYTIGNPNPSLIASAVSMTNQAVWFTAVYIPKSVTITGVRWWQTTNGSFTANNYNGVGLYSISSGTLTLVASSTNDGNCWQQGTQWQSKAFSSTYAASAGVYYIAAMYSQSAVTTAPQLGHVGSASGTYNATSTFDLTNSQKTNGSLGGSNTSLPSTQALSGVSAISYKFGFYLY